MGPSLPALFPLSIQTDGCSGKSLVPRQTCKVTYRFMPDSEGSISDSSTISTNGNTVTLTISGTGTAGAEPVANPVISHTSKTTQPPPTLSWENSGNTKFKVWFGNGPTFS